MSEQEPATVGVIGLGNMGRGIAMSFIRAGHDMHVWDVEAQAREAFAGSSAVTPPAEMGPVCSLIIFVVPGSKEIDAILSVPDGLMDRARPDLVLFDFTTSDPAYSRRLAERAAAKGLAYLDAGMTGGAKHADAGELNLMIGGDEAALERVQPVLAACTNELLYMGPSGAGHTMKLIHNLVTHANFLAACEGGRLAERAGIDLGAAIEVLNKGNARSFITERRFPDHILSDAFDGRSRVFNLHKDIGMAVDLAISLGAPINIGRGVFAYLEAAMERGMSETDFTRLYPALDELAGRSGGKD